mmetsp:Transcript_141184/g.451000  ORF Transcript_141184/g.451000 Transcript_141184/m.451000 type:complete len:443 (-) Transcript_141184:314-1642(-)
MSCRRLNRIRAGTLAPSRPSPSRFPGRNAYSSSAMAELARRRGDGLAARHLMHLGAAGVHGRRPVNGRRRLPHRRGHDGGWGSSGGEGKGGRWVGFLGPRQWDHRRRGRQAHALAARSRRRRRGRVAAGRAEGGAGAAGVADEGRHGAGDLLPALVQGVDADSGGGVPLPSIVACPRGHTLNSAASADARAASHEVCRHVHVAEVQFLCVDAQRRGLQGAPGHLREPPDVVPDVHGGELAAAVVAVPGRHDAGRERLPRRGGSSNGGRGGRGGHGTEHHPHVLRALEPVAEALPGAVAAAARGVAEGAHGRLQCRSRFCCRQVVVVKEALDIGRALSLASHPVHGHGAVRGGAGRWWRGRPGHGPGGLRLMPEEVADAGGAVPLPLRALAGPALAREGDAVPAVAHLGRAVRHQLGDAGAAPGGVGRPAECRLRPAGEIAAP